MSETPFRPKPNVSSLAVTALIVGIASLLLAIFVIGALIAPIGIVLAIIALVQIKKRPAELAGKGLAVTGLVLSALTLVGIAISIPLVLMGQERDNRVRCAANLRGIAMSMNVYAADQQDSFPVVPPSTPGTYFVASGGNSGEAAPEPAMNKIFQDRSGHGSVTACWWLLVLKNQVAPKTFLCRSDRTAGAPAAIANATSKFELDFANGNQFSYSSAYPWVVSWDGSDMRSDRGGWWRNVTDSTLPIMSDIAPKLDAVSGVHANSANHGSGTNVVFSDVHVEFAKHPEVGQKGDNIWTHNKAGGPSSTGNIITGGSVGTPFGTMDTPYDVIMVPIRDASGRTY